MLLIAQYWNFALLFLSELPTFVGVLKTVQIGQKSEIDQ